MSEIKLLNDVLISQIAAGEVVERPSNAIKELVENSIDAGAKNISVEVEEGGKKLIRVIDDGKGIFKEDLELAVMRHATSKIHEEKDLFELFTLGFRGEALSSIASVSKLNIKSRKEGEMSGFSLNVNGGELENKMEVAMNTGTTVTARELFFNTPARRKFLKSDSSEIANISLALYGIALSYPGISFKLTHNAKKVFNLSSVSSFKSRIIDVFGESLNEALLPVFFDGVEFKMDGFIGKPTVSRSNTKQQFLFVNGRSVKHAGISALIKQAYHSMLMEHKNPAFFINLRIDPKLIDVNVHPKKSEIRFLNQQEILSVVYKMVKKALEQNNLMPKGLISDMSGEDFFKTSFERNPIPEQSSSTFKMPSISYSGNTKKDSLNFTRDFLKPATLPDLDERNHSGLFQNTIKVFTQINNSYIIAEDNGEIVLIDQHAGHERVLFEKFMDQFENAEKQTQNLLIPQLIELAPDEKIIMEENLEIFTNLGFDIESFGGNSVNISGVPKFLANENLEEIIKGVVDDLINNFKASKFQGKSEAIITYMSCRGAIKFGQKLSEPEMTALITQMKDLKRPYTCPHGRPTMISLNMDSLEKMFGRS
jgi:DNA mismatch repair protein MutL